MQSLEIRSLGHVDLEAGKAAGRPLQELTREVRNSKKTYNLSWRPVWGLDGIGWQTAPRPFLGAGTLESRLRRGGFRRWQMGLTVEERRWWLRGGEGRAADGLFNASAWLSYRPPLFMRTLIWVLVCRYFVDTIKIHNQLTLSKGDYPI